MEPDYAASVVFLILGFILIISSCIFLLLGKVTVIWRSGTKTVGKFLGFPIRVILKTEHPRIFYAMVIFSIVLGIVALVCSYLATQHF